MMARLILTTMILGTLLFPSHVFAQARSIESFVGVKDQWDQLVGTNWKIEGRYAFIGGRTLRFVNCEMPFIFAPNVEKPPGRYRNMEVTGKIERQDGRIVFLMDSVRAARSDSERLRFEMSKVETKDAEGWYKLADWAIRRADFYEDDELRLEGQNLKRTGLEVEFRKLEPDDLKGMAALVRKANEFDMDEALINEFIHDSYWNRFRTMEESVRAVVPEKYANLMVSISRDLDGAEKPLGSYDAKVAEAYYADAEKVYRATMGKQRVVLERYFYLRVTVAKIEKQAEESGNNGLQIAKQLKLEAPERKDLFDKYLQLGLDYESKRVAVMTQQEMLQLARTYEESGQEEMARTTKRNWLNAREGLYKDDGARGLVDFAEEWIQLLNDRETAAKYYIAAWKQNAQYPLAASWLKQNGYSLYEGNWTLTKLVPKKEESAIDKAIREGRIEIGMTTAQVKTAMGVAPDSMVRFATSEGVTEMWLYESARIMVRFTWTRETEQSLVDSIRSMAPVAKR